MEDRSCGILMHISSLPGEHGIGDFGEAAYDFADVLKTAKVKQWQVLPLNPTDLGMGNSPYASSSAYALNPLFINPEFLVQNGYLEEKYLTQNPLFPDGKVNYKAVVRHKIPLLSKAYEKFVKEPENEDFNQFCREHDHWLNDFSMFVVLKDRFHGECWNHWPVDLRDRHENALAEVREVFSEDIRKEKFIQFLAFRQWYDLKQYCNDYGISLVGDIPIYVQLNSADVWANQHLFKFNDEKQPIAVAGVPPDYFSETGQLWGNPVYNWDEMQHHNFSWWVSRLGHNLNMFDQVRIDHFRGLVAYWEVPAGEETAVNGSWVKVPADAFFERLKAQFPALPLIAEDLGLITDDVREFLARTGLPGMRVLQFGFMSADPKDQYLPHNFITNCIVYTGTHDNNTVKGWYSRELNLKQRTFIDKYLGKRANIRNVHIDLVRLAIFSVASTVIIPLQDMLGLDYNARMNKPGVAQNNWTWRLHGNEITNESVDMLKEWIELSGR